MEPSTEPQIDDAFGQLLLAQYADPQEPQYELVERDDGFLGVTDARAYFSERDQLGPLEALACQEATGQVLDMGCGAGRHSLVMMARGLQVTGLEPSPGPLGWLEIAAYPSSTDGWIRSPTGCTTPS